MQDRAATRTSARDINGRIARLVRALRAEHGMTLDALAARSHVSRSMLSLVERGESSPTAVELEKIATGLGVPLAALFDDPAAPASPVSRRADRTAWRDPQSGYVRRNISPAGAPSPIQLVEVIVGRVTHRLSEDDCLAMRLDEPTAYRNRTRRPARYVVAVVTERSRAWRR